MHVHLVNIISVNLFWHIFCSNICFLKYCNIFRINTVFENYWYTPKSFWAKNSIASRPVMFSSLETLVEDCGPSSLRKILSSFIFLSFMRVLFIYFLTETKSSWKFLYMNGCQEFCTFSVWCVTFLSLFLFCLISDRHLNHFLKSAILTFSV